MISAQTGIYRTGTSNIVVPGNKSSFPEAFRLKTRLQYYASLFNSLEVNSSFYKVPLRRTFERWSKEVPADFQFTIKLWKGITHAKDLLFDTQDIDRFMIAANALNDKKGCILVQFPASITSHYIKKITALLQQIKQADPYKSWRIAVEFRHRSWYNTDTYQLLDKYNAALVLQDMPASSNESIRTNAPFVFIRFHGEAGDYRGSYPPVFLQEKAGLIRQWLHNGLDVYAYFNNTIGDAFNNAITLRNSVETG